MWHFFFQAEDGIRDLTVTGVQTCALPISSHVRSLVPQSRVEWAERAQGFPVRGDQQVHIALERDVEREAAPKLTRGDAQHRLQVAPEALRRRIRSEEHTSELQSQSNLVCRLLL